MDENKDRQRKMNSCFEDPCCAEMMQKISGEEGIGSLCEEMMRLWMKECYEEPKGSSEAQTKEAMEKKDDQECEVAQGKTEKPSTGGAK